MIDLVTEFAKIARVGPGAIAKNDMDYQDPDIENHNSLLARDIIEDTFPLPVAGMRLKFGPDDIVLSTPNYHEWDDDDVG